MSPERPRDSAAAAGSDATPSTASDAALASLAGRVGTALAERGWRLVTVESCTGGWIAKSLTDVAGSSGWFEAGLVTYSNAAKTTRAGVPPGVLDEHGAVSEPVVRAMAEGGREAFGAEVALAVSGIAGPGGGTPDKPVGLVWLAWALPDGTIAESRRFAGDREAVRRASVAFALERLLELVAT